MRIKERSLLLLLLNIVLIQRPICNTVFFSRVYCSKYRFLLQFVLFLVANVLFKCCGGASLEEEMA